MPLIVDWKNYKKDKKNRNLDGCSSKNPTSIVVRERGKDHQPHSPGWLQTWGKCPRQASGRWGTGPVCASPWTWISCDLDELQWGHLKPTRVRSSPEAGSVEIPLIESESEIEKTWICLHNALLNLNLSSYPMSKRLWVLEMIRPLLGPATYFDQKLNTRTRKGKNKALNTVY